MGKGEVVGTMTRRSKREKRKRARDRRRVRRIEVELRGASPIVLDGPRMADLSDLERAFESVALAARAIAEADRVRRQAEQIARDRKCGRRRVRKDAGDLSRLFNEVAPCGTGGR